MASKYLGDRFDIHTGGVDHIRVHHTNEVAQSECALGVHPWVSIWMHNEFLDLGGEKMSKSKGHVLVVDTLVEQGIDPLAYRYFCLQAHYRQQQAFSFDEVEAAGTALRPPGAPRGGGPRRGRRRCHRGHGCAPCPARRVLGGAGRRPQRAPGAVGGVGGGARPTRCRRRPVGLLADFDRALGFGLADAVDPEADESDSAARPWPPWWPSARPPVRPGTSPPPTASATSWRPRASRWSTPRRAPPWRPPLSPRLGPRSASACRPSG